LPAGDITLPPAAGVVDPSSCKTVCPLLVVKMAVFFCLLLPLRCAINPFLLLYFFLLLAEEAATLRAAPFELIFAECEASKAFVIARKK
jgi:hypothetical protein